MVEAILQYGKHHPGARILICAPSNAAADVLLSRLAVSLPKSELFRYNSYQRDLQTADAIVREYSKYDAEVEAFQFPGMVAFLRYRYVVCTCIMAGKLHNYGVPRGTVHILIFKIGYSSDHENTISFSRSFVICGDSFNYRMQSYTFYH